VAGGDGGGSGGGDSGGGGGRGGGEAGEGGIGGSGHERADGEGAGVGTPWSSNEPSSSSGPGGDSWEARMGAFIEVGPVRYCSPPGVGDCRPHVVDLVSRHSTYFEPSFIESNGII
jgi:hypothetical protein